jgi:hypothetical protein
MKLDDFLVQNDVKNINVRENNDYWVMRNVIITFTDNRTFELICHKDNFEKIIRKVVLKNGRLGTRNKKIKKIINVTIKKSTINTI